MHRTFAFALLSGAMVLGSSAARAQQPPVAPDSTASDTVVIRHHHDMMVAFYALVLAPAGLVAIARDSGVADSLPFSGDHVSFSIGGGLATGINGPMGDPNYSQSAQVELYRRGNVVSLRAQRWMLSDRHVDMLTVRVGNVLRPRPRAIGSVTVGFRWVPEVREHQGFELAFPFIGGRPRWRWRLESAYLVTGTQFTASYQARYERRLGSGPWTIGLAADFEDWAIRKDGRLSHQSVGLVIGSAQIW